MPYLRIFMQFWPNRRGFARIVHLEHLLHVSTHRLHVRKYKGFFYMFAFPRPSDPTLTIVKRFNMAF